MKISIAFLIAFLVSGCSVTPPTPFHIGDPVPPVQGCADYRTRGGNCWSLVNALQTVLDEAHAAHEYITDEEQHKREEHWVISLKGDCEDFALWSRQRLEQMGIGSDLVYAVTEKGEVHVVLSVEGWILDNRFRRLARRDDLRYEWIRIGRPDGRWYEIES